MSYNCISLKKTHKNKNKQSLDAKATFSLFFDPVAVSN